jgi:prevent-host-death family protein
VQELKANLSSVLQRVGKGERVRITRRGRYVADLLPPETDPAEAQMRKLIAEGKVTPASAPLDRNPPPPRKTGRSASAVILAEREEDR